MVLLDLVAGVLCHLPQVEAERRPFPRMADYAQVLLALDRAMELDAERGHFAAYCAHVRAGMAERGQEDPVLAAMMEIVDDADGEWTGNAEALRRRVAGQLEAGWNAPRSARAMSAVLLTTGQELLRANGYHCTFRPHGRKWTIRKVDRL